MKFKLQFHPAVNNNECHRPGTSGYNCGINVTMNETL